MTAWRSVLFDLDDTLYLERDFVFSGMWAVACWAEQHLERASLRTFDELVGLFHDGVRASTFDEWLKGQGLEPLWIPHMVRVYREHSPAIKPLPGVPELLARLRTQRSLGLVSDGIPAVQRRKLEALRLGGSFDAIVLSDELGRECWKPSPVPFMRALGRLSTRGCDALYVADNPAKDFRGARDAGIFTIRIRHPYGLYCDLEPASVEDAPNEEISSIDDFQHLLESLTY